MNQHYLPKFYLNHFCVTDQTRQGPYLWVLRNGRWGKQSPSRTASAEHFYTIDMKSGEKNLMIENMLSELENQIAPILQECADSPPTALDEERKFWLALFVVSMWRRTPDGVNDSATMIEDVVKFAHRQQYQYYKRFPEKWQHETMTIDDFSPDRFGGYKVKVPNSFATFISMKSWPTLAEVLCVMDWTMLFSESGGFVSSDNPVACNFRDSSGVLINTALAANEKMELTFPLTPHLALWTTWKQPGRFRLGEATTEWVRAVNIRTLNNAINIHAITPTKTFPNSEIVEQVLVAASKK